MDRCLVLLPCCQSLQETAPATLHPKGLNVRTAEALQRFSWVFTLLRKKRQAEHINTYGQCWLQHQKTKADVPLWRRQCRSRKRNCWQTGRQTAWRSRHHHTWSVCGDFLPWKKQIDTLYCTQHAHWNLSCLGIYEDMEFHLSNTKLWYNSCLHKTWSFISTTQTSDQFMSAQDLEFILIYFSIPVHCTCIAPLFFNSFCK